MQRSFHYSVLRKCKKRQSSITFLLHSKLNVLVNIVVMENIFQVRTFKNGIKKRHLQIVFKLLKDIVPQIFQCVLEPAYKSLLWLKMLVFPLQRQLLVKRRLKKCNKWLLNVEIQINCIKKRALWYSRFPSKLIIIINIILVFKALIIGTIFYKDVTTNDSIIHYLVLNGSLKIGLAGNFPYIGWCFN